MSDQSFTGAALEEALRSGKLDRPMIELVGMVKAAEERQDQLHPDRLRVVGGDPD